MFDFTEDLSQLTLEELMARFPENGGEIHRALKTGLASSTAVLFANGSAARLQRMKHNNLLHGDVSLVSDINSNKRSNNASGLDCWGRIPERDMLTICSNCKKQLFATRFAAHAEKCLLIRDRTNERGRQQTR